MEAKPDIPEEAVAEKATLKAIGAIVGNAKNRSDLIAELLESIDIIHLRAIEVARIDFRFKENKEKRAEIILEITSSINKATKFLGQKRSKRIVEADVDALFSIAKADRIEAIGVFFRLIKHYTELALELNSKNQDDFQAIEEACKSITSSGRTLEEFIRKASELNNSTSAFVRPPRASKSNSSIFKRLFK